MKVFLFWLLVLAIGSSSTAAPDVSVTSATCKADLKSWSATKTETLTVEEIMHRMNEMVACAEQTNHHSDKKTRAYLDEFYRTHSELASRAFDFIVTHNLRNQFYEEENGTSMENAKQ